VELSWGGRWPAAPAGRTAGTAGGEGSLKRADLRMAIRSRLHCLNAWAQVWVGQLNAALSSCGPLGCCGGPERALGPR
jgi:hypothetical protein